MLLGDVLTTGYFAARRAEIRPDGICVVLGCGDASCVASCSAMNPNGATLYRELLLCAYCGCNGPIDLCQNQLDALTPPGTCN